MNEIIEPDYKVLEEIGIDRSSIKHIIPRASQRHYRAAANWLTKDYYILSNASNLDRLRRYLEAFHHLCTIEDWDKVGKLIEARGVKLNQLQNWGYYQEMISLYSGILYQSEMPIDMICANRIGNAYYFMSEYSQAIDYWQKSLEIARHIKNRDGEGMALGNLGAAFFSMGNYNKAIEYHKQRLEIAHEMNNPSGERAAAGNLGNV